MNTLVDVGGGVRETFDLSRLTTEESVEVRSDFVGLSSTKGMALSTSGLNDAKTRQHFLLVYSWVWRCCGMRQGHTLKIEAPLLASPI